MKKRARDDAGEDEPRTPAQQNPTARIIMTRNAKRKVTSAATHAVLFTTELLEEILLLIPMRDLLLDQRVCKKWKNVIEGNSKLQQKLFFQPREFAYSWLVYKLPRDEARIVKVANSDIDTICAETRVDRVLESGYLNPLLVEREYTTGDRILGPVSSAFSEEMVLIAWNSKAMLEHPDGSWRRMLPFQSSASLYSTRSGKILEANSTMEVLANASCRFDWLSEPYKQKNTPSDDMVWDALLLLDETETSCFALFRGADYFEWEHWSMQDYEGYRKQRSKAGHSAG